MKALLMKQLGVGFLLPHGLVTVVEIDEKDKLKSYYKHLGCDTITIVTINIDEHEYDIVADDEALLKDGASPTLYINDDLVIFGSLCFVKVNENGESIGLDDEDIERVRKYIKDQKPKLGRWQDEVMLRNAKAEDQEE